MMSRPQSWEERGAPISVSHQVSCRDNDLARSVVAEMAQEFRSCGSQPWALPTGPSCAVLGKAILDLPGTSPFLVNGLKVRTFSLWDCARQRSRRHQDPAGFQGAPLLLQCPACTTGLGVQGKLPTGQEEVGLISFHPLLLGRLSQKEQV